MGEVSGRGRERDKGGSWGEEGVEAYQEGGAEVVDAQELLFGGSGIVFVGVDAGGDAEVDACAGDEREGDLDPE